MNQSKFITITNKYCKKIQRTDGWLPGGKGRGDGLGGWD